MMDPTSPMPDQPDVYSELFQHHYDRILSLCRLLLGDRDLAEEVCQDVFLKLHVALTEKRHAPSWERWLTRVAVNGCRDLRRRRWWKSRRATEAIEDHPAAASGMNPEQAATAAAEQRRIRAAFGKLSARQREIFVLRHLEEWTTAEVAEALSLDPGTVKRHLFRAVAKLRRALGENR